MLPPSPHLRPEPMALLLPPQISRNSNASVSSSLPVSFPRPIEDREDFFCVNPTSLSIDQLTEYKNEMRRQKTNLERIQTDANARLHAYRQGIALAEETMKLNSSSSQNNPRSIFVSQLKPDDEGPIGCVDPKTLTSIQLQLYVEGIREEISYEEKLSDIFEKESRARLVAYSNGNQRANDELSRRKSK